MDHYRTLGVERGCTREDVKAAFRARARVAHPDLGGDEQAFIQVCAAYKHILLEVPPDPIAPRRARSAPSTSRPRRPPPKERPNQDAPRRPDRLSRRSPAFDSNWSPELVLSADVGRDGNPAPPPDPQWQPDLVLEDEARSQNRPVPPLDPNWRPAVVFLDETSDFDRTTSHRQPASAREQYRSLLGRISARSTDDTTVDWQNPWVRTIGFLVFAALVAANVWLCWIAWSPNPDSPVQHAADPGTADR